MSAALFANTAANTTRYAATRTPSAASTSCSASRTFTSRRGSKSCSNATSTSSSPIITSPYPSKCSIAIAQQRQQRATNRNISPLSTLATKPQHYIHSSQQQLLFFHSSPLSIMTSADAAAAASASVQKGGSSSDNKSSSWGAAEITAATLLAAAAAAGSFLIGAGAAPSPQNVLKDAAIRGGGGGGGGSGGGGGGEGFFVKGDTAATDDTSSTEERTLPKHYDVSVRALKGGRLYMEDEYFIARGGRFAAVFDGHGGSGVSGCLRERLYRTLVRHLRQHFHENPGKKNNNGDNDYDDANMDEDDDSGIAFPSIATRIAALRSAFEEVEDFVIANDVYQYQGSTAVSVMLHEDESGSRTLISANVGDSRAVLSRRGKAVDLTRDHKPNDEREKARILAMGEQIEWDHYSKVYRVRNLSLSRAIGDRFAKPAVSGEAEIKCFPLFNDGDEFVVLASDGLWDVMSSQDAVNFVHRRMNAEVVRRNTGSTRPEPLRPQDVEKARYLRRRNMARFVANEALRRGSGDNVSVVIIWLNDMDSVSSM